MENRYFECSIPWLIGCLWAFGYNPDQYPNSCKLDKNLLFYILCYIPAIIPILIHVILIPIYIVIFAIKYIVKDKKINHHELNVFHITMLTYIFPQNFIHWLIFINYTDSYFQQNDTLFLLLILCISISILWYSSFIYLLIHFRGRLHNYRGAKTIIGHQWKSNKLYWCTCLMEYLLLIMVILIVTFTDHGTNRIFGTLTPLFGVLCIPFSMPMCCKSYCMRSAMLNHDFNCEHILFWLMTFGTKEQLYDKIYAVIHCSFGQQQRRDDAVPLLDSNDIIGKHKFDGEICKKYVFQYVKLDAKDKRQYIEQFGYLSIWQRLKMFCGNPSDFKSMMLSICLVTWMISRVWIVFIMPWFWFFMIISHQIQEKELCGNNTIHCMLYVFIMMILVIYGVFIIVFYRTFITLLRYEYWFGYYAPYWRFILWNLSNSDKQMEITRLTFNIKRFTMIFRQIQNDIAIVICSYLSLNLK